MRQSIPLIAVLAFATTATTLAQTEWRRTSPFTRVDVEYTFLVQFQEKDYELVSIEGLSTDQLVDVARTAFGGRSVKRIVEDLPEVLEAAGKSVGDRVELVLKDRGTGKIITVAEAPMTKANRARVMQRDVDVAVVANQIQKLLEEKWSYLLPSQIDLDAAIGEMKKRLPERAPTSLLKHEIQKIIALGIDGHAKAGGPLPSSAAGYLPVLIEPTAGRFIAFQPDRKQLVNAQFPYLESIDHKSISAWCDEAAKLIPRGSPQYVRRHALRALRTIQPLREQFALPTANTVTLELVSEDGTQRKSISLDLTNDFPIYGTWPRFPSRLLDGEIGYLRLEQMDDRSATHVREMLSQFQNTKGLIVDVRDNGGGTREALLELFSYIAQDSESPRVANAAVYRRCNDFRQNHLANRYMYREDSDKFDEQERAAITKFKDTFQPEWQPPSSLFSKWHYLVLKKKKNTDYNKPVIVLMNAKCFSATDIFLAGLKGLENVTLLGQPSGGGSARSRSVRVGDIQLRLGSMVSYQPNGLLFDGHGVQPDILVDPTPQSFTEAGTDNVLERAIQIIREKS
jgi:hypothetical protein